MHFELSATQLFTICAMANGFVFGLLLLDKKENRGANRFLSLMILCLCLTFTPYMLDASIWHRYYLLAWMPFSISYWIGPSLYFYVRALTRPDVPFRRRDYWHFSLIFLNYLHSLYHLLVGNANPYPWLHKGMEILESGAILSILIYMMACFKMINRYQEALLNCTSSPDPIDLSWIQRMVKILGISFLLIFIFLIVSSAFLGKKTLHQWDDQLSAILLLYALILYWFSIHGYRQAQTITIPVYLPLEQMEDATAYIINRLKKAMANEHLYRKPDLSLSDLSKSVGISERALSKAINQGLQKNYFQFVNEYRVEEMKARLVDPQYAHLKIYSIALEVGFNSKASFNRVFKSYAGCTPKQYQMKNR